MKHLIRERWRPCLAGLLLAATGSALAGSSATLTVKVTVIAGPPCVINNNGVINVNFNNVPTDEVDGIHHEVPINYPLDCTGATKQALKLKISGAGATFDLNVLKTTNDNLGIQLLQGGSKAHLAPDTPLNFTNGQPPALYAVLVKNNNATLSGGPFSAGATLTIDYQ
jgi:type 1 fimbria pilin